jgi:hypothetical protein
MMRGELVPVKINFLHILRERRKKSISENFLNQKRRLDGPRVSLKTALLSHERGHGSWELSSPACSTDSQW